MNLMQSDDTDREVSDLLHVPGQGRLRRQLRTISEDEEDSAESEHAHDDDNRETKERVKLKLEGYSRVSSDDTVSLDVPIRLRHAGNIDKGFGDHVTSHSKQNTLDVPDISFKPIAQSDLPNLVESRRDAWYEENGEKIIDEVLEELLPYNPMFINRHRQSIPTIVLGGADGDGPSQVGGDDRPCSMFSTLPDGTEIFQEPDVTNVIQVEGESKIVIKKKRKIKIKLPAPKVAIPRSRSPVRGLLSVTKSIFGFSDSDSEEKENSHSTKKSGIRRRLSMFPPMFQPKAPPNEHNEHTQPAKTRLNRRSMSWSVGNLSRENLDRLRRISAGSAKSVDAPPRVHPDPLDDLLKVKQDKRLYLSNREKNFLAAVPYIRGFFIGLLFGCFFAVVGSIIVLIIPWDLSKTK